ncbi:low density lipoprotein receptor adapter protein 1-like [Glandiceps talaboti]
MQDYERRENIFQKWMRTGTKESPNNVSSPRREGMEFYTQHLGSQLQSREPDLQKVATMVRRMVGHVKSTGRKMPKCKLTVADKYIKQERTDTGERAAIIPIHCVQYCASDVVSPKIFVFIACLQQAYQVNVHYCYKRVKAEALTVAFAKSFKQAYRDWELKLREQVERQGQLRARNPQGHSRSPSSSGSSTPPSPTSPTEDIVKPKKGIALFDIYGMHTEFKKRQTLSKKPHHLRIGNDYRTLSRNNDVKRYLAYGDSSETRDDPDEDWSQYSY